MFQDKTPEERRDEAAAMRRDGVEGPLCPSCHGFIPRNERPGEYMGALSRRDNVTEICSACGQEEAFVDLGNTLTGSAEPTDPEPQGPRPHQEQRPPTN